MSARRRSVEKALLAMALAAAFFSLPYCVPVRPAISLSYVVGYSNRAAVLLFILGAFTYAVFTRGHLAERETENQELPVSSLVVAIVVALSLCLTRHYTSYAVPGYDADYLLDRQQLLAVGMRPWQDMEFPYGPLLLYPGHWIASFFHVSEVSGYYVWLDCQFVAGVAMLWVSLRFLDFPVRYRRLLFVFALAVQLPSVVTQGSNYTPFRFNIALCCAVLVQTIWKRTHSSYRTAAVAMGGFALGLGCSPEQALALFLGLSVYLVLLTVRGRPRFPWPALIVFFVGSLGCLIFAARLGMFIMLRSFSAGGFAFPIMPSPHVLLFLLPYVFAACVCWRAILQKDWESPAIPLALVGAAMLPYALGRADLSHIQSATPAYVLGLAVIFSMPSVRRWLLPLMSLALLVLLWPRAMEMARNTAHHLRKPAEIVNASSSRSGALSASNVARSSEIDRSPVPSNLLPCDQLYFSPTLVLSPVSSYLPHCLDRGYYRSDTAVFTTADVMHKIDEMRTRPNMPLLLQNEPFSVLFADGEADPAVLRLLQLSPFLPSPRYTAVTVQPIADYITAHYRPGPLAAEDRVQIWYPLGALPAPAASTLHSQHR